MKIIVDKGYNPMKGAKRFFCRNCGCIFEADDSEYTVGQVSQQFSDIKLTEYYYKTSCPLCSTELSYKKIEDEKHNTYHRVKDYDGKTYIEQDLHSKDPSLIS